MEDFPRTLFELEERFSTNQACLDYLYELRWPDGFVCPRCGHQGGWRLACETIQCPACSSQTSVTAGTIFHRTRKPLTMWFRAIWWVTSQKTGASALGLQRILGLGSYKTAWSWLHKLRRAMVRPGRERLSGRVEVDETYWGASESTVRGREMDKKSLIVIAAEEDGKRTGRIRMRRIAGASAKRLESFITDVIEPGSVVHTDGWDGYAGLASLGYAHEVSVLARSKKDAVELLPRVHHIIGLFKKWLHGTHQGAVSREHLDYYLDEYTFRFNRRTSRYWGKLFYRLLQNAVVVEPAPYKSLVKNVRGPGRKKRRKYKM
jgi:transposase-like protein